MIKQLSVFNLLFFGLVFIIFSCNNAETIDPLDVKSSDFKESAAQFLKNYKPSGKIIDGVTLPARMPTSCAPGIHGDCLVFENITDTLPGEEPNFCEIAFRLDIMICKDEDGNVTISFDHTYTNLIRPDLFNDVGFPAEPCKSWFIEKEIEIIAGNLDLVKEEVDQIIASAINRYEEAFMTSYLEYHAGMYLCNDDLQNPSGSAIKAEYYMASCSKVCEVGNPLAPAWQVVGCGDGCCVKTREYCEDEDGNVESGPATYRYEEGLCADRQGELLCKPIIECASSTCPEDS